MKVEELLLKEMEKLNSNLQTEAEEIRLLKVEIETARTTDEANRKFMQELVMEVLRQNNLKSKRKFDVIMKYGDIGLKIILVLLMVALGIQNFAPL